MTTAWDSETMGEFAFSLKLGFDADDLLANRADQLTPRQRRKVFRRMLSGPIFIGVFDVVTWQLFETSPKFTEDMRGFNFSLLFVFSAFVLWYWAKTYLRDFFDPQVAVVEGVVRQFTEQIKFPRRPFGHTYQPSYAVTVNYLQFRVSSTVQGAFADRQPYRIYYLPYSQTILSAERIQAPQTATSISPQ